MLQRKLRKRNPGEEMQIGRANLYLGLKEKEVIFFIRNLIIARMRIVNV